MKGLPDVPEELTTERLLIRAPRVADVPALHEAVLESLPELKPWLPWAEDDYSLQACESSLRNALARFITREDLRFHFLDGASGEFLGSCGLHRIDWRVPRFEIGYWIRTSRSGQGLTSECAGALAGMALGTLGAQRVEIRCDDLNLASARVAEKCGFHFDAVLRNWKRRGDGSLRDERIYSKLPA